MCNHTYNNITSLDLINHPFILGYVKYSLDHDTCEILGNEHNLIRDGQIIMKLFMRGKLIERLDGPAIIVYEDGKVVYEEYRINNRLLSPSYEIPVIRISNENKIIELRTCENPSITRPSVTLIYEDKKLVEAYEVSYDYFYSCRWSNNEKLGIIHSLGSLCYRIDFKDGKVKEFLITNNGSMSSDYPSFLSFYDSGFISSAEYYLDNKLTRKIDWKDVEPDTMNEFHFDFNLPNIVTDEICLQVGELISDTKIETDEHLIMNYKVRHS